jgi:hypothetical protein
MKLTYAQVLPDGCILQSEITYHTPVSIIRRCTANVSGVYRLTHPGPGGPNEWKAVLVKDLRGELAELQAYKCARCYNAPKGCPARQQVLRGKHVWKFDCKQHALFIETCLKRKK